MRYRLRCLTPLLVGDGNRLAAVDYMVWKDQVNVLDQKRIFKLLAKGPRLEGYLTQLKKADRLDFASWGGFAQNFANRRIAFEDPVYAGYWQKASGDALNVPTFAAAAAGPFLPAAAIKGALRTAMLSTTAGAGVLRHVAKVSQDRPVRHPAEIAEEQVLGSPTSDRMRFLSIGDSDPVDRSSFAIYLVRTATLQSRTPGGFALGWKQSPRGAVDGRRPEDSTPIFAEMAGRGTVFEGEWRERRFFNQPEIAGPLKSPEPLDRAQLFAAANAYAAQLLAVHKQYAAWTGLDLVAKEIRELEAIVQSGPGGNACLLCLGWGGGLLAKTAWHNTEDLDYRRILQQLSLYSKALSSGLPFPKTRRIVFLSNKPAALPGWVLLELR